METIVVKNLTKKFQEIDAVKNLSFKVGSGEVFGFLGPNGAGKTTTMQIIAGIIPPSSGECWVKRKNVEEENVEVKRIVGYLPENDFLYPSMEVYSHLDYIAELYDLKKENKEKRISELLDLLDIEELQSRKIKTLSKGQKRKVSIAKSLVHNPEIIILDELTAGLDPTAQEKILKIVDELRGREKTIIFSTHILEEVEELCERLLIISEGKRRSYGQTEKIISQTNSRNLKDAFFKLI